MITSSTQHQIAVGAPRGELIGVTSVVEGWPVLYVGEGSRAAIHYRKYVAYYSRRSDRPWKVGKNSYASLSNALRSLPMQAC